MEKNIRKKKRIVENVDVIDKSLKNAISQKWYKKKLKSEELCTY